MSAPVSEFSIITWSVVSVLNRCNCAAAVPVPSFKPVVEKDATCVWFADIPMSLLSALKNPVIPVSLTKVTLGAAIDPSGMLFSIVVM